MQLLNRLNKLSIATGVSPDELLSKMLDSAERSIFSSKQDISPAVTRSTVKTRRQGWSPAQKRAHGIIMKQVWAERKNASKKASRKPRVITPEHKAKLMAGLARYRLSQKLQANA